MKQMIKTMMLAAAVALAGMAAFAAESDATWKELTGSTSGMTLDSGYYFIRENTTFSNATAGGSGLSIADKAIVYIYIPEGVTLTATGAAGSGTTGGGAGIHLPKTSTLNLIGSGTVNATGGAAAAGSDGKDGEMPSANFAGLAGIPNQDRLVRITCCSGNGGAGGAGGGGGGAGIGTPGGTGGAGGAGGSGFGENGTDPWRQDIQNGNYTLSGIVFGNGRAGVAGSAGGAAQEMGTLSIQSTITQEISGGAASATAGTYVNNATDIRTGVGKNLNNNVNYRFYAFPGAGGGGGGSGYAGANIGTGGGGGGGGGGGQAGGASLKSSGYTTAYVPQSYVGGGGTGNKNGTGSTSSSKIVKIINVSSIEDSAGGRYYQYDDNAVRYGGAGADAGAEKAAGTAEAPVYAVAYLDKDGAACGTATYAVGSATSITLPACEAGYKWVNTVYGKPCGEPSDLSSAPVAAFTGTINARNVYGDLTFKATKDGEEGNPWSVGGNVVAYMDGTGGLVVSGTGATGDFSKKNPAPWAAFADQIRSVTIEPGVTQIGSRFFKGCTRLGTVTGGKDLISVGENAFYQCMSLETIKLDNADVLDSLKNAIVYQTAIKEDGSLYTIPAITLPNCESVLYGTNDLSDPNSWQPVDSNKTMQASGYHFFKFVLKKIGE